MKPYVALALCLAASPAVADLSIRFDEGAPKDRFSFENTGTCPIVNAALLLDLSGSSAGLIFDVTGRGAGVEVFQPLEIVSGSGVLATVPQAKDGDNRIAFEIAEFAPGALMAFTIDVDDTVGAREITVSDSEIVGARVALTANGAASEAVFTSGPRTVLPLDCQPSQSS